MSVGFRYPVRGQLAERSGDWYPGTTGVRAMSMRMTVGRRISLSHPW